jgi:hypothetical protein
MRALFLLVAGILALPSRGPAQERAPSPFRTIDYGLDLRIDHERELLTGRARLTLVNEGDSAVSRIPLLLYRLMTFHAARDLEGRALALEQDVVVFDDWPTLQLNAATIDLIDPVLPQDTTVVEVDWAGPLLGYAEVMGYVRDRIDPAFTIVRDDTWAYPQIGVPSWVANRRGGLGHWDYHARVTAPATTPSGDSLVVANGGRFLERVDNGDGTLTWVYENRVPAWRMDFAVAPYATLERGGHRIYHFPADSAGARRAMEALEGTLALYSEWLGPLRGDPGFAILELEDGFGAQADVSSILQPAAAFRDSTRVNEIYHEIKHLWDPAPTDVSARWNEGLATWFEYRTADVFGETSRLQERVDFIAEWVLDQSVENSDYGEIPMIDYGERGTTDLAYSVGFLMFDVLNRLVGEEEFHAIVGGFYQRYAESGASTEDFVHFADATSRVDLRPFFQDWMYTSGWYRRLRGGTSIRDFPALYDPPSAPGQAAISTSRVATSARSQSDP